MDSLQAEQVLDDALVPSTTEPTRVEALRGDTGKEDLEIRGEVVPKETAGIVAPQGGEDTKARFVRHPVHPIMLVVRGDGSDDDAIHFDALEKPPQGIELSRLAGLRGLGDEGPPHRFGEHRGQVEVRDVEQHRVPVVGEHGEEMGQIPAPLDSRVRRVSGILSAREQRRDSHAR